MIVRPIDADFSSLTKSEEFKRVFDHIYRASDIRHGEHYLVVAMAAGPIMPWYYLADRFSGMTYPLEAPACMFEITEPSFSRFWDRCTDLHGQGVLAPKHWMQEAYFFGELFEGNSRLQKMYDKDVEKLYLEFPLPWIQRKALWLGEGLWVSDEEYDYQWEISLEEINFAMIRHPDSNKLLHNPLYERI